jgi:hypothetical protein
LLQDRRRWIGGKGRRRRDGGRELTGLISEGAAAGLEMMGSRWVLI